MTVTGPQPVFRIVRTGQGMGGFLCPPGHPNHVYEVRGYWPRNGRAVNVGTRNRGNGADSYGSLDSVLGSERGMYPDAVVAQAQRIMDRAELTCSEDWVRSVYGYFRNSYSPDGVNRNVSDAVSTSGYTCACGEHSYSRGVLQLHINQVLKAMLRLRKRWTRALETAPAGPHHLVTLTPPPEHHLGYLLVREYFPDHKPRLDLIAGTGSGYGSRECAKCGKQVQYEAREDAWCEVLPGARWRVSADCPEGGRHVTGTGISG